MEAAIKTKIRNGRETDGVSIYYNCAWSLWEIEMNLLTTERTGRN